VNLNRKQEIPLNPFSPVVALFLTPVDSDLFDFLKECHELILSAPRLLVAVDEDLDKHGLRKKAVRVADAEWVANRTRALPCMPEPKQEPAKPLVLKQGRPRTLAYVVIIALLLRGFWGAGFKSSDVTSNMQESMTLSVFFTNLGMKMPGRSTLTELVNAVTNDTRLLMLDAQVARALQLNLDDFKTFLQDSTHVDGNTTWPTDSRLMVDIVARLIRVGEKLGRVHLTPLDCEGLRKRLKKMTRLDLEIAFSQGKKGSKRSRRRRYEKLLRMSEGIQSGLTPKVDKLADDAKALDMRPSRKAFAERAVERLRSDLEALNKVCAACEARVIYEKKVPISDKILSLSDPDAGFISKGQRVPVIGYKPQLARSANGFLTGIHLPQGNAPDSKNLLPMVDEVSGRTKVIPAVASVDDGYASKENWNELKARGIEVVSISGAKGRALTPVEDWESDVYGEARNKRSAVESLMYTLKQGFDFGEVARRGLEAVYGELIEKGLAYNTCVTVRLRRKATERAMTESTPTKATG